MFIPSLLLGRRFIENGLAKAGFHVAENYVLAEDWTAHPTAGVVLRPVPWLGPLPYYLVFEQDQLGIARVFSQRRIPFAEMKAAALLEDTHNVVRGKGYRLKFTYKYQDYNIFMPSQYRVAKSAYLADNLQRIVERFSSGLGA